MSIVKLNIEQLQTISMYLDSKELTQVDLRNELIDHIANGIEKSMDTYHHSFKEAYRIEIKKWHTELADYSSLWIGWAWHGPKIMIKKCAQKTREIYVRTAILSVIFAGFFYILSLNFNMEPYFPGISNILGLFYFGCFAAMLFFYFRIVTSGYQSSYRYLFKTLAVGSGFIYLIFNPLALNLLAWESEGKIMLASLLLHSYFTYYSYTFWELFKSHRQLEQSKTA